MRHGVRSSSAVLAGSGVKVNSPGGSTAWSCACSRSREPSGTERPLVSLAPARARKRISRFLAIPGPARLAGPSGRRRCWESVTVGGGSHYYGIRPDWKMLEQPPALAAGEVHVWTLPLEASEESLRHMLPLLTEAEQRQAYRFVRPELTRRFITRRGSAPPVISRIRRGAARRGAVRQQ